MRDETRLYYDEDADLSVLQGKTIAVVGYGNQGRAQALNMRDSGGSEVIIGSIKDESWDRAKDDGFPVCSIKQAAQEADIGFILLPDEVAPKTYESQIEPVLEEGNVLNFASGYNITFGHITPPEYVDVIMVAPRMIGTMVRELYQKGRGAPAFLAVEQDYSGEAKDIALALAKMLGATRAGVIEGTFDMETKSDLLTEQGLLPIFISAMIAKYELEVEEGIPPEAALMELYLSREIAYVFEEMAKHGLMGQMRFHSRTSQYGQLSRLDEIMGSTRSDVNYSSIKEFMRKKLVDIDNGKFAREWHAEKEADYPKFKKLFKKYANSNMIEDEQRTMKQLKN